MRFQSSQGRGDDTATNGFRFTFCKYPQWNVQQVRQFSGVWGSWRGLKMCPQGSYINGFRARIQSPLGGSEDDTAFNGLRVNCFDPVTRVNVQISIFDGFWGNWYQWLFSSSVQNFMTAFKTRFQYPCGKCDDTGLNGLSMLFGVIPKISKVQFSFNHQQYIQLKPFSIEQITVINRSRVKTKKTITFTKTKKFTQKFQNQQKWANHFSITMGLSAGLQEVLFMSTGMTFGFQHQNSITFANETSFSVGSVNSITANIPKCSQVKIAEVINFGNVNIHYCLKIYMSNGQILQTNGTYYGVVYDQIKTQIQSKQITNCF